MNTYHNLFETSWDDHKVTWVLALMKMEVNYVKYTLFIDLQNTYCETS